LVRSVTFSDANNGWAVGPDGIILHTTTGGTGVVPPPPPGLNSPPDGSLVSTTPTLNWGSEPGALYYTLQVSQSPYFVTTTVNQANITETSYQMNSLDVGTTYYWRVSVTTDSSTSGWSQVWSFTHPGLTDLEEEQIMPTTFSLHQNYPNPFNPSTTIRYGLPERSHVLLEVYNLAGQRVATLIDGEQQAGWNEVVFEDKTLASGLYFYRLQAGDFVETRKLILIK
jgi:hypothetical protein